MAMPGFQSLYRALVVLSAIGVTVMICFVSQFTSHLQPFQYPSTITDTVLSIKRYFLSQQSLLDSYVRDIALKRNFTMEDLVKKFDVSSNGSDVIIFLRVQKTGSSSLSRHLSDDVDLRPACNCSGDINKCSCLKRWRSTVLLRTTNFDGTCGLHEGYARLLPCVDKEMDKRLKQHRKRRHLYITMARDPLRRYLSEWMHVRLHGQWGTSPKNCQYPTATKIWVNVTLDQFMKCPSNPAINRQAHMLGFQNRNRQRSKEVKDMNLVKSAMDNLKHFAYFGLTEYQELSQILFEETFNIHFIKGFETVPQKAGNITLDITDEQRDEIDKMNRLDRMYFDYAVDLFRLRILKLIEKTTNATLRERLLVLSRPLLKGVL